MMKKVMMFTFAAGYFLFCFVSPAQAWDVADRAAEGKQLMVASNFMISQAQKMKNVQNVDRAMLVDEAHLLINDGANYLQGGQLMYTDEGSSYMQQVGQQLLSVGGILLKMGRQKGVITQKEKDEIVKQADALSAFGKLMFANGQTMGGNL